MAKTLQQQIEEYPDLLCIALEDRLKWDREVDRLEASGEEETSDYSSFGSQEPDPLEGDGLVR